MKYLSFIRTPKVNIKNYAQFDARQYQKILNLAKKLTGAKILHINSSGSMGGGGVAELLKNQIPLEQSLNLDSRWLVIKAPVDFFQVTKKIHNLLQGKSGALSIKEKRLYLNQLNILSDEISKYLEKIKQRIIVVIHDPQPLPIIDYLPPNAVAVARLHIDLSQPNKLMLDFLRPYLEKAQRVILSNHRFRPSWLASKKTIISYPAINPLSLKNKTLSLNRARSILKKIGLDTTRPIITQVSRFDHWKDPQGVVEAYYLAKKHLPNLQLVLKGDIIAQDDPEAKIIFEQVKKECQGDPNILLQYSPQLPPRVNYYTLINALQQGSDIIIQKSLREGFDLTCAEAMWKGKAVIAGNVGGLKIQIQDGKNGFLVNSAQECAQRIVELIKNPKLAKKLGQRARQAVQKKFLIPRLILDHLKIYQKIY